MNLREQILDADDMSHEDVEVPEWGVTVRVKSPTVRERANLVAKFMGEDGRTDFAAMYPALVIATAVDPTTGELLFTDEDTAALEAKSGRAMERVAQAALRVSGMNAEPDAVLAAGKDA